MQVKFRHRLVFAILRPVFKLFLKIKFGYSAKKYKGVKGPYFILSNHVSMLDPFMIALSFKEPIYFVASDDIFSIKFFSPIISYLVSPIPKTKGKSDVTTIKHLITVAKQGGSVAVFPSGNTTYSGVEEEIPSQLAKLAKILKLPIVLYNTFGLYGIDPRWRNKIRKGKSIGKVAKVLEYKDYKDIDNDVLDRMIIDGISTNAYTYKPSLYKSKRKAEYLERALFLCPDCHSIGKMKSDHNRFFCKDCKYELEYQEDLSFVLINGKKKFLNVKEYYDFQINFIKNINYDKFSNELPIIEDEDERLILNIRAKEKKVLQANSRIAMYLDRFVIKNQEIESIFMLKDIKAFAIQGRNKLLFYTDENLYQLKGSKRRSALKYVYIFYAIKHFYNKDSSNFMGI